MRSGSNLPRGRRPKRFFAIFLGAVTMTKRSTEPGQQMDGICWLVGERLIFDTSSLSEAEPYGECMGHRRSHIRYWSELKRTGVVKPGWEYDDLPRGRVTYNAKKQEFYLLLDECIRKDKAKLAEIMKRMHLPANTIVDTDLHY